MRRVFYTTSWLVLAAAFAAGPSVAEGACIADWSLAAPIVKSEGLAPVETLSRSARTRLGGEVVKTTLCRRDGTYVYDVVVKMPGGQVKSQTLDAREPFSR